MKLFLIRHLPTAWNEKGKLQGRKDIPIKKPEQRSLKKIENAKKELNKVQISNCFSSPLKRAIGTAKEYGFESPTIDDRIIEYDFGKYEGKRKEEMLASIGTIWFNQVENLNLGERFDEFQMRVDSFLQEKRQLKNVLVFSHGFVIRYILAQYYHQDINRLNHLEVKNNHLYDIQI